MASTLWESAGGLLLHCMQSHAAQEVTKTVWTPLPCYQSWRRVGPEAIGDVFTIGDVFVLFSGSKLLLTCLLVLLGEWKLVPRWTDSCTLQCTYVHHPSPIFSPHTRLSPPPFPPPPPSSSTPSRPSCAVGSTTRQRSGVHKWWRPSFLQWSPRLPSSARRKRRRRE